MGLQRVGHDLGIEQEQWHLLLFKSFTLLFNSPIVYWLDVSSSFLHTSWFFWFCPTWVTQHLSKSTPIPRKNKESTHRDPPVTPGDFTEGLPEAEVISEETSLGHSASRSPFSLSPLSLPHFSLWLRSLAQRLLSFTGTLAEKRFGQLPPFTSLPLAKNGSYTF